MLWWLAASGARPSSNAFTEELVGTANYISQRGKGILASDESNATTGKRLATVGETRLVMVAAVFYMLSQQ